MSCDHLNRYPADKIKVRRKNNSISDERGLNFDRNAAILLNSHFLNLMNMKTHFWLLLVSMVLRYIELVACSVWHCHMIFIFTQTIEQTIVSVCTSDFLAFLLFFFYHAVCKQVERLPLLVIKTMTLKSQTNINRQQDARWRKKFVRARLITLVSQSKHEAGKRS